MTEKHEGSCVCGGVRFEVIGPFESFFLCHCQRCRKGTGTAHAANLFSSTATLKWVAGEEFVRSFQVAETRHLRAFCAICGSALPTATANRIKVPAGALDSEISIRPNAHIFCEDRAGWDEDLEHVEHFERYP